MANFLIDRARGVWTWIADRFPKRSLGYWATAAVILALTTWTMPFIDSRLNLVKERNWLFQHLTQSPTNRAAAGKARLVLIKDDEFWDGDLHHRIPTDRRYLARLIRALDDADVSVIALDFDLRLPQPDRVAQPGDYAAVDVYKPYRDETDELIRAIDEVAQRRKIVLAKTIAGPDNGPFHLSGDVFQPYGLCTGLIGDGVWRNPGTTEFPLSPEAQQNISCGYIALMDDERRIPPPAVIEGDKYRLDSFALAIVRARDPLAVPKLDSHPYFGAFVPLDIAKDHHIIVSAHDLLQNPQKAKSLLQAWPVIVGAGWHQRAKGVGMLTDMHDTPIGDLSGALIHENLAEAMLGGRIFPGLSEGQLEVLEISVSAIAAIVFAAINGILPKIFAVAASMVILFFLQWLILQLFGIFLDSFIPVLAVGLHAVFDRLVGEADEPEPQIQLDVEVG